jgi:hypothetical protein
MVAGESVANNVLKCRLKSIQTDDYHVSFTSAQRARLKAIFPQGVCDFTKPGIGQVPTTHDATQRRVPRVYTRSRTRLYLRPP